MIVPSNEQRMAMLQRPVGRAAMRQRWSGLLFLHWPIDPAVIQARLPKGLYVDTFEGRAWIGVVPFFMERVRPAFLPPVPWLSWFLELNVRTYVYDSQGRAGVWFFSLDCNQPVAVEIARRAFHLPYEHAAMRAVVHGGRIQYFSRRRTPQSKLAEYAYQAPLNAKPASANTLEWFLVERYLLFSRKRGGQILHGRVHHQPYRIAPAKCEVWSTEPLRLNGFSEPVERPPSVLGAERVDVTVFGLKAADDEFR